MTKLSILSCLLTLSTLTNATFLTHYQEEWKPKFTIITKVPSWSRNIVIGSFFRKNYKRKESSPSSIMLRFSQKEEQSYLNSCDDTLLLNLPIFPLRKKVRFPTDKMNLNLYEPRYLALAERVLEQEQAIYGAIYCSQKPQMVSYGGLDPITPIVEPGDVGLLCEVYSSNTRPSKDTGSIEDGNQLMDDQRNTKEQKRRIQLSARGVGRFRIEKVLKKGYSLNGAQDIGNDDIPYIVVEASLLKDEKIFDQENEKIDALIKKYSSEILPLAQDLDMIQFDELCKYSKTDRSQTELTELYSPKEIFTFALASKLIEKKSAQEMLRILTMTSTLERLEYVLKEL